MTRLLTLIPFATLLARWFGVQTKTKPTGWLHEDVCVIAPAS